ncbi:MAG TPA: after-VIT domain-containing protein [Oscillatoriaceae cyanobacterium M33_DOE_052]|uniref:After-VIT domain-containing protein n=1 Tax=Planktothricoides sp. SpSt-374 TaxID=2282167 RepID=A0A7C3ZK88_9CYAN|nr:after-VIT domain-containing protein [Oscillatoriaceae cyanobacterium M33_DOE_052]
MSVTTLYRSPRQQGGVFIQGKTNSALPLKHTEVNAKITGNLARVQVTQIFANELPEPLQAIYVFPLPDDAAINGMEIHVGSRLIKGHIINREEARELYAKYITEGRTSSLLEQERDNIFTQSLANIKPGEEIQVTISYTEPLKFSQGNYEFVFPMVVCPRYIPGNILGENGDTDVVPDASRITPPLQHRGAGSHNINVYVEINAGLPLGRVWSPSHEIIAWQEGKLVKIKLDPSDVVPNKDLIVRYRLSGEKTQATVLTQRDERGGHFAVYLIPALTYPTEAIVAKDVVFLIDTSGSQYGAPLEQAQALMRRLIQGLHPQDTFAIIDFANTAKKLAPAPLANTPENRRLAVDYIDNLTASGGTELIKGMQAVLNFPEAKRGRLRSIVLLTDGYIGNDKEAIARVQQSLPEGNRLYCFGVGTAVNRFLLNRLAEVGRGLARVIRPDEPINEIVEQFCQQINNPVLTNIQVHWQGNGEPPEIYPSLAPDLFAQEPLVLCGRKADAEPGILHISGITAGGYLYEQKLAINFKSSEAGALESIAQLWARQRIKHLTTQMLAWETTSGIEAVSATALSYHLLSPYTAFIAVSPEVRVDSLGRLVTVEVPQPLPEFVSYEGIFGFGGMGRRGSASLTDRGDGVTGSPLVLQSPLSRSMRSPVGWHTGGGAGKIPASRSKHLAYAEPPHFVGAADRLEIILTAQTRLLEETGFLEIATDSLTRHLQQVYLPRELHGEAVFLIQLQPNSRVLRVILDDTVSTVRQPGVIFQLKQSLQAWVAPIGFQGKMRIVLRILP